MHNQPHGLSNQSKTPLPELPTHIHTEDLDRHYLPEGTLDRLFERYARYQEFEEINSSDQIGLETVGSLAIFANQLFENYQRIGGTQSRQFKNHIEIIRKNEDGVGCIVVDTTDRLFSVIPGTRPALRGEATTQYEILLNQARLVIENKGAESLAIKIQATPNAFREMIANFYTVSNFIKSAPHNESLTPAQVSIPSAIFDRVISGTEQQLLYRKAQLGIESSVWISDIHDLRLVDQNHLEIEVQVDTLRKGRKGTLLHQSETELHRFTTGLDQFGFLVVQWKGMENKGQIKKEYRPRMGEE